MVDWWQPLVGMSLGWVLSQSGEWWRQKRRARQYRTAIYAELKDVHSTIKTRSLVIKEALQTYVNNNVFQEYPADISNIIFKAHFAEVSLQFSESERLSLVHIHSLVDALNNNFLIIRSNWDSESGDQASNDETLRRAVQIAQGSYLNARTIDLMIELLLRDRNRFDIRDTHNAERLNRRRTDAEEELRSLNKSRAADDE